MRAQLNEWFDSLELATGLDLTPPSKSRNTRRRSDFLIPPLSDEKKQLETGFFWVLNIPVMCGGRILQVLSLALEPPRNCDGFARGVREAGMLAQNQIN